MDDDQQQRFARAVERKKEEARAASHNAPGPGDRGGEVTEAEQAPLHEPGRSQDVRSVRDKNSGHGKKTADKWNQ
jgi:hypothetical protein